MFAWENYIATFNKEIAGQSGALPWNLSKADVVRAQLAHLDDFYDVSDEVAIHETAVIEEGAIIKGPAIIGPQCFVGAHAYLRAGVWLIGRNSIGPGCEIKSSIIFPGSNLAHFNFVGDSVIGSNVNFEAGAVIANHYNEREDKNISVLIDGKILSTGVIKFGAVVSDGCRVGANAVLSPGTILSTKTIVPRLALIHQVP